MADKMYWWQTNIMKYSNYQCILISTSCQKNSASATLMLSTLCWYLNLTHRPTKDDIVYTSYPVNIR